MTKPQEAALDSARTHAQAIASQLKRARNAHAEGDDATLKRAHRAAAASCDALDNAHDSLERALVAADEPAEHDPIANPSAAAGAQTSAGQSPRAFDAESIRQRDQRRGIEHAYEVRKRLRGVWP